MKPVINPITEWNLHQPFINPISLFPTPLIKCLLNSHPCAMLVSLAQLQLIFLRAAALVMPLTVVEMWFLVLTALSHP